MAVWLIWKAGWQNIDLNLSGVQYDGFAVVPVMIGAIALVVSYFSGPMLNFGDFSRYGKSFNAIKMGNFLGLPINFLGFSLLTVVCIAATLPVYGKLITDPVEMVGKLDNTFVVILGSLTLMIATIGINIVANFVSAGFDFSNIFLWIKYEYFIIQDFKKSREIWVGWVQCIYRLNNRVSILFFWSLN